MAILEILKYPNDRLKKKASWVDQVDDSIRKLLDDMAETMYAAPGVGLAANQVGVLKRIAVIDADYPDGAPRLIEVINPKITERNGSVTWEEGCLSFPEIREDVVRSAQIRLQAQDRLGQPFELEADGFLAVVLQHELDHLDGITLIDHVSFLKRRIIHRQMTKVDKD